MTRTMLIAAAVSLAALGAAAQQPEPGAAARLQPGEVLLEVDAIGEAPAPSDAILIGAVSVHGQTLSEAIAAARAAGARAVAAVTGAGVPAGDVRSQMSAKAGMMGFVGNAAYGDGDDGTRLEDLAVAVGSGTKPSLILPRTARGQTETAIVQVRVRDRARLDRVVDALAASGVERIVGPGFETRPDPAASAAARARAIAAARTQAEADAAAAGMRIARVLRISERVAFTSQNLNDQLENGSLVAMLFLQQLGGAGLGGNEPARTRMRISVDYALVPR